MGRRVARDADVGLVPTAVLVLTVTYAAAISYGALLLLLRLLLAYELSPLEEAAERERLRRSVWALCMLLTALLAWKIAGVMPWPVAVGVCAATAATSTGGFVALFQHRRP